MIELSHRIHTTAFDIGDSIYIFTKYLIGYTTLFWVTVMVTMLIGWLFSLFIPRR